MRAADAATRSSMRGELQRVLESILERDTKFDHIVVETTGLANPGPVAAEFWVDDDELESKYYLDAIVTVCDAKHVLQHLDDAQRDSRDVNEAERQLAFADRIILNKVRCASLCAAALTLAHAWQCDLVDEKQLDEIEKRIRAINSQSPVIRTVRSRVALDQIIGINAFSPKRAAELLAQPESEGAHSTGVTTVSFVEPRPLHSIDAFKQWFASLLWETDERASDLFRIKGVLSVKDSNTRHVLQAVHETFDIGASGEWGDDEERLTRMVFIGRKLDRAKIKQSFEKHAVLGEPVEIEDET